jgi:hypothetical protein
MNKSLILALCTVFTFLVLLSSCSDKLNQPGFPGFRCNLNGSEYIADTSSYIKSLGTNIYAYTAGTKRFTFNLVRADTVGTFALDTILSDNTATYTDGVTLYRSISGSVVITQFYNDSLKMVTGYFNFTGRVPGTSGNTISISDGYFNNIPRQQ